MKASEARKLVYYHYHCNDLLDQIIIMIIKRSIKGYYSVVLDKSPNIEILNKLIDFGYEIREEGNKIRIKWQV